MSDKIICDCCKMEISEFATVQLKIFENWCKNKTYHFCTKDCFDKFTVLNGDLI